MNEPETAPDPKATTPPATVDAYVQGFPDGPREVLEQVHAALRRAVPGGEEKIRYGMPAIMFADRYGMHFAGWKKHVGLYPVGELDPDLEAEVGAAPGEEGHGAVLLQGPRALRPHRADRPLARGAAPRVSRERRPQSVTPRQKATRSPDLRSRALGRRVGPGRVAVHATVDGDGEVGRLALDTPHPTAGDG